MAVGDIGRDGVDNRRNEMVVDLTLGNSCLCLH